MHSLVQPNGWVALKLPSGGTKVLQVTPNTTISLGKYGQFSSNLIIHRPYHLTYELLDKREGESFSRLRVVPASELHADIIAEEDGAASPSNRPEESDRIISVADGVEYSLVDPDSGAVVARSAHEAIDENARQTLTQEEIEELKRDGTGAGKDLIAKLMLSHLALDQKTSFSLAKYKVLKTKKYIRRFQVLPLDVSVFDNWMIEERDASRVLELRGEMIGLLGCWANVHFGGEDLFLGDGSSDGADTDEALLEAIQKGADPSDGGRWLVVDDTSGLLVAAMAERMGILYPGEEDEGGRGEERCSGDAAEAAADAPKDQRQRQARTSDFRIPYSQNNTITLIHPSTQPNLSFLTYYGFDAANPNHPPHPLSNHLLTMSWLQLVDPSRDAAYSTLPPTATPEQLAAWKPNRRGNYHRKRRRYARTRHTVDAARAGGFAGLVCASTMDATSVLRHTLPLLRGGAPVAIYSATLEPLVELADCFSVGRRSAWTVGGPEGRSADELERWPGSPEFPINPTLLLGACVQTSRARRWQVLPARTHPLMTARGGAEGYVFTGWRARPAEGKVEARGKFKRRKREGEAV